jgi:hypothetical protein
VGGGDVLSTLTIVFGTVTRRPAISVITRDDPFEDVSKEALSTSGCFRTAVADTETGEESTRCEGMPAKSAVLWALTFLMPALPHIAISAMLSIATTAIVTSILPGLFFVIESPLHRISSAMLIMTSIHAVFL